VENVKKVAAVIGPRISDLAQIMPEFEPSEFELGMKY
jgi:hypothetical protein